jgi:ubiquinone/menaquinone biosynthesis C-methylase UbiE
VRWENGYDANVSDPEQADRDAGPSLSTKFGVALVRSANSKVYAEYCGRVHGTDLFHFNMVDAAQLQRLVEITALGAGDRFVDLGCGVGALTAEIARRTGADGIGVDFAAAAIAYARGKTPDDERVRFVEGDLNALDLPEQRFDAAIAVDTLYFVQDLPRALAKMFSLLKPGGRFAAFYTCFQKDDEPGESISIDGTKLAKALRNNRIAYKAIDLTAAAQAYWRRAIDVTAELEHAWVAAGEADIWKQRHDENQQFLPCFEADRAARYLYWATAEAPAGA